MSLIERRFHLADAPGVGVACTAAGFFVDRVALLERGDRGEWRARPLARLNADLSRLYRLPIDLAAKHAGVAAVARALDQAQIRIYWMPVGKGTKVKKSYVAVIYNHDIVLTVAGQPTPIRLHKGSPNGFWK